MKNHHNILFHQILINNDKKSIIEVIPKITDITKHWLSIKNGTLVWEPVSDMQLSNGLKLLDLFDIIKDQQQVINQLVDRVNNLTENS